MINKLLARVSITLMRRKFAANSETLPTETVEIMMICFSCPCKTAAVPMVMLFHEFIPHRARILVACILYGVTTPMSFSCIWCLHFSVAKSTSMYSITFSTSDALNKLKRGNCYFSKFIDKFYTISPIVIISLRESINIMKNHWKVRWRK